MKRPYVPPPEVRLKRLEETYAAVDDIGRKRTAAIAALVNDAGSDISLDAKVIQASVATLVGYINDVRALLVPPLPPLTAAAVKAKWVQVFRSL